MAGEISTESLGEQFGAVARRLRAASMASLSAWDVTPSQMRAIRILTSHEGGVRSSELAHHLHIAPRSATEVVDALEAKGLVRRSPDPSDRRATLVSLTARGSDLMAEVRRARGLESERLFEQLSKADRTHLARILGQLQADQPRPSSSPAPPTARRR
jgi:DNA-binding MarR family transcriptional regulator